jgi:diaminopimelate decarboxylase
VRLAVEPGRAIVSRVMVTLYHVLAVKHATGVRAFVAVDDGMSDNPRPGPVRLPLGTRKQAVCSR